MSAGATLRKRWQVPIYILSRCICPRLISWKGKLYFGGNEQAFFGVGKPIPI
jgi:hypothetical protein